VPPSTPLSPRPLAALCAVADVLARARVRWLLTGSAGRALLGSPTRPGDIDLEVDPHHAAAAAAVLGVQLSPAEGGGRRSLRASALRAGVEVDVTCDLAVEAPGGLLVPDFELMWSRAHTAVAAGREIRVAPLEEQLCRAILLGDWAAVAKVAAAAGRAPGGIRLDPGYVAARLSSATASATR
jgi:hypothetical protein